MMKQLKADYYKTEASSSLEMVWTQVNDRSGGSELSDDFFNHRGSLETSFWSGSDQVLIRKS